MPTMSELAARNGKGTRPISGRALCNSLGATSVLAGLGLGATRPVMFGLGQFKVENCRSKGDHNDVDTLVVVVANGKNIQPAQSILLGNNLHAGDPVHDKLVGPFNVSPNSVVTVTFTVMNSAEGNVVENTAAKLFQVAGVALDAFDFSQVVAGGIIAKATNSKHVVSMIREDIMGVAGLVFDVIGAIIGNSNPDCSGAVLVRSFIFGPGESIAFPSVAVIETATSPHECGCDPHSTVIYSFKDI